MILVDGQEILTVLNGVEWGGARDLGARTFNFSILYNPLKKDIKKYRIKVGSTVEYIENEKKLFMGTIQSLSYNTDDDTISYTCVDFLNRFIRSKYIGRYKDTLTNIANSICGLFGLTNGIKSNSTQKHNIVSTGDLTYYDVLHTACESVFGKEFTLYMDGKTLKLAETSTVATLEIGKNVRSSYMSQSIDEIVTSVQIIDSKGKILNTINDDANIREFGMFREVYNYSKDVKDNKAEARKLLNGVNNEARVVCNNDNNCISGRFVKIIEPVNNLQGIYRIETDNHTIGVDSSMSLEVKYVRAG